MIRWTVFGRCLPLLDVTRQDAAWRTRRGQGPWSRRGAVSFDGPVDIAEPKGTAMKVETGDRITVRGHRVGEPERHGEVLEVRGDDGGPPYQVRWDDGHESLFFPGSDVVMEHHDDSS